MATNCAPSQIQQDLLISCDIELTKGVDAVYYVGQLRQLANPPARDAGGLNIVKSITMKTGEKLSRFEGFSLSTKPKVTRNKTDFGVKLPQTIDVVLIAPGPEGKLAVEALNNAVDVFFIYKKKGITGEWEEMGIVNGMEVNTFEYDVAGDSSGAFLFQFTNPDARRMPATVRHTVTVSTVTTDDTASYLESLCRTIVV